MFSSSYARFRGSAWFVLLLCVFLTVWFAVEWRWPAFDPGFGTLNVLLSSEASLSVALLIMANERQDRMQRKQLQYMYDLIEANHAVLVGCDARTDIADTHGCLASNEKIT